jgi:hypothetical protein
MNGRLVLSERTDRDRESMHLQAAMRTGAPGCSRHDFRCGMNPSSCAWTVREGIRVRIPANNHKRHVEA